MPSFEEFYKYLLTLDKEAEIEGEIAGRTVYILHVHQDNAERIIKLLEESHGARVFNVCKPEDMLIPEDEELEKLEPEERKKWEAAAERWVFRCYVPPSGDEKVYLTSEILEKFVEAINKALKYDNLAMSAALMANFECNHVLAENHQTIRCNAAYSPQTGKPVPTVSAWGVINGLIHEVTGERLSYKTRDDSGDLEDIRQLKDPIVKVMRQTK